MSVDEADCEDLVNLIVLEAPEGVRMLGMRETAKAYAIQIRAGLNKGPVVVDFAHLDVTQGFVDELVGRIALEFGQQAFKQITFAQCTETTRRILMFVIKDRLAQRADLAP